MAGLDCAEVSAAAWPSLRAGIHATVTVDDQDTLSTSYQGPWKYQSNVSAVNGSFSYALTGTTPDSFTWDARVPSDGDYQVQGFYFQSSVRGKLPTTLVGATSEPAMTPPSRSSEFPARSSRGARTCARTPTACATARRPAGRRWWTPG